MSRTAVSREPKAVSKKNQNVRIPYRCTFGRVIPLFGSGAACRAISMIVCSKRLDQPFLRLYRHTDLRLAKPVRGSGVYKRGVAIDHTRRLHTPYPILCVESSDRCARASFCALCMQAAASSLLSLHCSVTRGRRFAFQRLSLQPPWLFVDVARRNAWQILDCRSG